MRAPRLLLTGLVMVGCAAGEPTDTAETAQPSSTAVGSPIGPDLVFEVEVAGAVAINVAGNATDDPVVAWITPDHVMTAALDVADGELIGASSIDGGVTPIAHPIERPAVAVRSDGTVDVAFTSLQGSGASVYHTTRDSSPEVISGEPQPETNLVHMTLVDDRPVLSWLENSTLSVALEATGAIAETELVDDLTCDCCNPVPAMAGGSLVVSYRDFDMVDGEIVRDVVAIGSTDGGSSFETPVAVADDHWFLSGCPFSGPSSVVVEDDLVVAWMDGRQSVHPDQQTTSIWVDRSSDAGATFGTDLEVTGEGVNRWPVMALDAAGAIHLVWETAGPDGGLSYATSLDGGRSFRLEELLVGRSSGDNGAPTSPSALVHHDLLIVTWTDSVGGHVAAWQIA